MERRPFSICSMIFDPQTLCGTRRSRVAAEMGLLFLRQNLGMARWAAAYSTSIGVHPVAADPSAVPDLLGRFDHKAAHWFRAGGSSSSTEWWLGPRG